MKKWVVLFFSLLILMIAGFGLFIFFQSKEDDKNSWKVEITHEYVNVRDNPKTESTVIGKAYQGSVYKVLSINLDHYAYVWYEIEFRKGQSGWIASERNFPYVKEYNNPNQTDIIEYEREYVNPVIRYYEDTYYVTNIDSITYNHLEIEEDSEYEISHKIYVEKCKSFTAYWIQYIVEDEFGNTSKKLQRISFHEEPDSKNLSSLSEIRSEICTDEKK